MRCATIAALAAAGLLVSACSTAEDIASYDIAGSTLSAIGITSPNRERPEDPKPRGPLVVPGSANLPQPRDSVATADPAWPRNAETQTEEYQEAREQIGREYTARMDRDDVVLRPDELRGVRGPTPNSGRRGDALQAGVNDGLSPTLSAAERRRQSDLALAIEAEQSQQQQVERRYLIDPPTEYRQLSGAEYQGKEEVLQEASGTKEKKGLSRLWPF